MTRNLIAIIFICILLLFFLGCSKTQNQINLTVSAASSLKDAMNELKGNYLKEVSNVNIVYNFGSTGSLEQQIENGADVDLFISAAQKQMDVLKEKGLLVNETRKNLLGNSIVLIVPKNSTLSITFEQLGYGKVKNLAMGEPGTSPVGQYAEEMFGNLKIFDNIKTKIIYGKDVKEVLTWVETENVDAGVVYETDAKISPKVKIVAKAREGSHKSIVYPASIIKSSRNKQQAKNFLDFLSGEKGKIVFEKYGFKFLPK